MIERWVFGIISVLVSLVGLLLTARTHEGFTSLLGLFIFAFGIFFIFQLIKGEESH